MKRISCFLYKHNVQERDLERTKRNLSATSCLKIFFLIILELLWIKVYVAGDFMAEMQKISLPLFSLFKKKKVTDKISFLNIHKIASYLYCPLSEILPLPFPPTSGRLQSLLFRHLASRILKVTVFFFHFPVRSLHIKYVCFCVCANKCWQLTIVSEMMELLLDLCRTNCVKMLKIYLKTIW